MSDVKTMPAPAPPEGFGSGEAEPSVKIREQPESRRDWTVLVAWDRASVLAEGERVEAEPRV
jgi:hypothetical protein